jgi:hypothetical protein
VRGNDERLDSRTGGNDEKLGSRLRGNDEQKANHRFQVMCTPPSTLRPGAGS